MGLLEAPVSQLLQAGTSNAPEQRQTLRLTIGWLCRLPFASLRARQPSPWSHYSMWHAFHTASCLPADQADSERSTPRGRTVAGADAFDILPTRGRLAAGCSQVMECSYYALPGQRAAALAVCEVEGGPSYRLPMSAESNAIK